MNEWNNKNYNTYFELQVFLLSIIYSIFILNSNKFLASIIFYLQKKYYKNKIYKYNSMDGLYASNLSHLK